MITRSNFYLIGGAALGLLACASTTPKADSPAQSAAAAPGAPTATAAAATGGVSTPHAVGATAGQPDAKPSSAVVTYLPKDKVADTFKKGGPLYAVENYKIIAAHRDDAKKPAEVHTKDTDVFYVVEGSATFVTGGELVDGAPDKGNVEELRGPSIKGGEPHKLQKGDVIVIPHGTPHWFSEVNSPFNYFIVKVQ